MLDDEFEKNVRKTMEELKFRPSDSVWEKVEQEINAKERRRRPLLWLFLLAGLTATGYLVLHYSAGQNIKPATAAARQSSTGPTENRVSSSIQQTDADKQQGASKNSQVLQVETQLTNAEISSQPAIKSVAANSLTSAKRTDNKSKPVNHHGKRPDLHRMQLPEKSGTNVEATAENHELQNTKPGATRNLVKDAGKHAENGLGYKEQTGISGNNTGGTDENANITSNASEPKSSVIQEGGAEGRQTAGKNSEKTASLAATKAKGLAANKKTGLWKYGFNAGAGISSLQKDLLHSTLLTGVGSSTSISNLSTVSVNGRSLGPTLYAAASVKPSPITPGFSFLAGAFVQRSFGKRFSISTGLTYQYFTTHIQTGSKVDSSVYFALSAGTANSTGAYYVTGQSSNHTNHFHFLDLPLNFRFQLNRSNAVPISLEMGGTVSRLITTDALQYNSITGFYYKAENVYNKTQFNLQAALMIGFFRNRTLFTVGPTVQYAVTSIIKNDISSVQHPLFTGIRILIIPKSK